VGDEGSGGEMTRTMYAHVNKWIKKNTKKEIHVEHSVSQYVHSKCKIYISVPGTLFSKS
jgi:hypothetical protein